MTSTKKPAISIGRKKYSTKRPNGTVLVGTVTGFHNTVKGAFYHFKGKPNGAGKGNSVELQLRAAALQLA